MKIELFSCAGGMAEGFRRAGLRFDVVIDKDANAVGSYERNLDHRPIQMDIRDLIRLVELGWRPSEPPELLVADPPCTPWSTAGKRLGLDDDRDCLRETVTLIRALRPRCYLIGNVPGLETAPNLHIVHETIGSLTAEGYCVADFAKLDAADYGVPQHRVRPFWFGHLDGPCLKWPARTHGRPSETLAIGELGLAPWVTCRDALGHLPSDEIGRPVKLRRRHGRKAGKKPRVLFDERRREPTSPEWPWERPATTVTKEDRLARPGHHDPNVPGDQFANWMDERPSTTVMAGDPTTGGPGHGSINKRPGAVVLSEKAATIIQGFPEDWVFEGKTKAARWSQIGQAMPPALAQAVATSVLAWLSREGQPGR